jgi:crotonobetaine/carnitine-CoA ligase
MIGHAQLLPRLAEVDRAGLSDIVVVGGSAPAIDGLTFHGPEALAPTGAECGEIQVAPWDTQYII